MPALVKKQSPKPAAAAVKKAAPGGPKSAWDMVDTLRVLLYGESGTGKTTFAATFPGPILWLVCSGGNKPGELRSIDTPEYRRKITPKIIETEDEFDEEVDGAQEYGTVVLDHASGFADLVLGRIIGKPIPQQKSWGLASQQDYGQQGLVLKEKFKKLLNLPGNVVIIAQERTFGGKDDGIQSDVIKPAIGAMMPPGVVKWLNPACDYVLQTYKRPRMETEKFKVGGVDKERQIRGKGVEYCLRTEPHEIYTTKFRAPKGTLDLPECLVDPDYGKLMSLIRGETVE